MSVRIRIILAVSILFGVGWLVRGLVWPRFGMGSEGVSIVYPFQGSVFPPEIIPPTIWWDDTHPRANRWRVTVSVEGSSRIRTVVDTPAWTPEPEAWEDIKAHSVLNPATVEVESLHRFMGLGVGLSADTVAFATSTDSVGAPIFYRDVPLPFKFALRNVPMIRWRLGNIGSEEPPPTVLTNLPVRGNCHSFSSDGSYLGMDVDLGSDKGAYALTPFEARTHLSKDRLISWSEFVRGRPVPTFGMLPRVSPSGRFVLAGVKDRAVFLPREDILFSQIFFPVVGILAYYDQANGQIEALPGADDENFVQSNATWSPDGKYVYFVRAPAAQLSSEGRTEDIVLTLEESAEVLGGEEFLCEAQEGGKKFLFDLYRVPFNEGRGGEPEPVLGASGNGASNYFAKISPDGRWLVFTQAHSFMLLQPDSRLWIMPAEGGEPRLMNANTSRMNSWHSWSPNGRWLVFSTKVFGPYTQLMLTHIDEDGNDSPPVFLRNLTAADRAANIPEFVNIGPEETRVIEERFIDDYSHFRSGRIYEQFREFDRAEEEFRKSLDINPENTLSLYSLASIYTEREDFEGALATLRSVLELDPNSAAVHADLGNLCFQMEDYEEAESEFLTAIRLDPSNIEARFNLGTVHLARGEIDEALDVYTRLLGLELDEEPVVRVHSQLAAIHLMRHDYGSAAEELERVLASDSDDHDSRYNLAVAYRALGKPTLARDQLETLVEQNPDDPEMRGQLAEVCAEVGDHAAAVGHLERVVELDPQNVAGWAHLGRLHHEMREFDAAETALLRVASLDPQNPWPQVSLGQVYYESGRFDLAVQRFTNAARMTPDDARCWFMLGESLIRQGVSIPEAIDAFQRGLSINPQYVDGRVTLGDLYARVGDAQHALEQFNLALALIPEASPPARDLRSRIEDLERQLRR